MNKNRIVILSLAMVFILACSVGSAPQATQPPVLEQPTYTPLPTYTPYPTSGAVEQATQTEAVVAASPTLEAKPAVNLVDTSWFGRFRWFGSLNPVTFVIQKVNGDKFEGIMAWTFTQCRITEAVDGDIFTDINAAPEQNRWAYHPDFASGDKSGTWLRWTQNESIGGTKCYLTISGDWWYAHINSAGHMTGIHFTNDTNAVPDTGATFDFTKQ
ncbi:MAG: hypothetical protein HFACDABA_02997 [Anaerolineales bacterium]|nr:hypothetical protein [Anaerolineales bacterium]